jgi:hypothetical protein
MKDEALWLRLQAFQFDDPESDVRFSQRLAKENGWSASFTHAALEEYRRFVYLSQVAGHPVTPSDAVDQAWHLHLLYTQSYWEDLCGEILGGPLHHGPTRGGAAEDRKHTDWYRMTLDSYREEFGSEPPSNIWPQGCGKFGRKPEWQRVNVNRHWLLPKVSPVAVTAMIGVAILAGCTGQGSSDAIFGLVILSLILVFVVAYLVQKSSEANSKSKRSNTRRRSHSAGDIYMHNTACGSDFVSHSSDSGHSHHGGHGHHSDSGGGDHGSHGGHSSSSHSCSSHSCSASSCSSSSCGSGCGGGGD